MPGCQGWLWWVVLGAYLTLASGLLALLVRVEVSWRWHRRTR
jgi:hypothetical protein